MSWSELVNRFWPGIVEVSNSIVWIFGRVILAAIIVLLGLYLAKYLTKYTKQILDKLKLDDKTDRMGINEVLSKFGFGKSPSFIIAFLLGLVVGLKAVYYAAKVLRLEDLQTLIEKFIVLTPQLFISLIIVCAGMLLAKFVAQIISNSAKANNLKSGNILAQTVKTIIILFAVLVAMENVGLSTTLVTMFITVVFASLGLAFAISFGLGARPIVEELLRDITNKENDKK
ncbi:Conserved TM helix [Parelusimicrobium proximum]|uniref:mechanosensitive ion channel family protein n=1 Tax=Parelusimicrobium proximum TaxID=3228953 RepID=UPI003D17EA83